VPMNFATALLTFLWPFARTKGSLIAVSVLYGICSGPYTFAFLAPLYGLSGDAKDIGGRLGMATTLSSFGDLVGLPIAGALLNTSLRYKAVGIFGGAIVKSSSVNYSPVLTPCIFVRRFYVNGVGYWYAGDEGHGGQRAPW
jgi:MCP family monocarboxylic acid transporter-like MFS transporter 10